MTKNLKKRFKISYKAIKNQISKSNVSDWLSDNFYCIDRHYRAVINDKNAFEQVDFYKKIVEYCDSRDYLPNVKGLIEYLTSLNKSFNYNELRSIRSLLAIASVLKIAFLLNDNNREYLLQNSIKLLQSLSDPDYELIITRLWHPEKQLIKFEEGFENFDSETKRQYREQISKSVKRGERESDALKRLIGKAKREGLSLGALLFNPDDFSKFLWIVTSLGVFSLLFFISLRFIGLISLLLVIPFSLASGSVADQVIACIIPPYRAPRLDLKRVPDDKKTLVTVAALLTGNKSDSLVFESLERFYYMNPKKNIYYCLLADLRDSESPYLVEDNSIFENARKRIDELNSRYGERFCLYFRERVLNKSEMRYGGWERKRGAVCELVSHIINGGKDEYYGGEFIRDIKYILTLDSDTNLSVGSVLEMLSIAIHPANRPIFKKGRIVSGYGIIQPTVRTELKSAYKTAFSRLITGAGGADVYSSAFFLRSQTLFGSGSFCGKGLIDVSLFEKLASKKLPEGIILSHDIIEGSLLRTLAATDIVLTDSTPSNTVSYFRRLHRWLRGDFQNLYFLSNGMLSLFSRFRILLIALSHLSPISVLFAVIIASFFGNTNGFAVLLFSYSEFFSALFGFGYSLFVEWITVCVFAFFLKGVFDANTISCTTVF